MIARLRMHTGPCEVNEYGRLIASAGLHVIIGVEHVYVDIEISSQNTHSPKSAALQNLGALLLQKHGTDYGKPRWSGTYLMSTSGSMCLGIETDGYTHS